MKTLDAQERSGAMPPMHMYQDRGWNGMGSAKFGGKDSPSDICVRYVVLKRE